MMYFKRWSKITETEKYLSEAKKNTTMKNSS